MKSSKTPQSTATKQLDFVKMKNIMFYMETFKDTIKKVKRQLRVRENICSSYLTKGLVSILFTSQ